VKSRSGHSTFSPCDSPFWFSLILVGLDFRSQLYTRPVVSDAASDCFACVPPQGPIVTDVFHILLKCAGGLQFPQRVSSPCLDFRCQKRCVCEGFASPVPCSLATHFLQNSCRQFAAPEWNSFIVSRVRSLSCE
jgi:hypothetical protein